MNTPDWHIAALRIDQIEMLCELARHIWRHHYAGIISPAQIDYMLDQRYRADVIGAQLGRPDHAWNVALAGTAIIGFAHCFADAGPQRIRLDKLYVHPAHQRRGVGAALLEQAISAARRQGRGIITLRTNKRNHVALAAYRKYGFDVVSEAVSGIGEGFVMDDYVLEKVLRQPDAASSA